MSHPTITASALLASWQESEEVSAEAIPAIADALLADAAEDRPPLHLKILSALGTFLATVFFLAFLVLAGLIEFDSERTVFAWGLVFLFIGVGLSVATARTAASIGRDVLAQSAFTAMALGKIMTVSGIVGMGGMETPWIVTGALLAVTVITYPVSGSSLDRVLSPYAVAVAALVEILGRRTGMGDPSLALSALYLLATAIAGGLLLSHRVPVILRPIGIAALATMGSIVALIASGQVSGLWMNRWVLDPRPIEIVLALSLIGILAWAAGGFGKFLRPPLLAAVAGIIFLGLIGAPGISFALLVLIVGHALYDTPLRVVGILALPAFLVLWYYGCDMTFLEKSAALVGSGTVLLAGRAAMALAGWDREEAP